MHSIEMTPIDLLAALSSTTLAMRHHRFPDDLADEPNDWSAFERAVAELVEGRDEAGLGRLLNHYGQGAGTALAVYEAWRYARILERHPVAKRRKRR